MYLQKSIIKYFKIHYWYKTVLIGNNVKYNQLQIVCLFNNYKRKVKNNQIYYNYWIYIENFIQLDIQSHSF